MIDNYPSQLMRQVNVLKVSGVEVNRIRISKPLWDEMVANLPARPRTDQIVSLFGIPIRPDSELPRMVTIIEYDTGFTFMTLSEVL